ncbi:vitamin K-dependent protein C-like [Oppia nitens]|uniref:vitamin K-dependent protein C-like n=1 Tax=Oppia nitens TaxID=1686743 RepID=UPI0023DCCA04|nr:vitamin K-dependent protein C-like [Oppia nitens]
MDGTDRTFSVRIVQDHRDDSHTYGVQQYYYHPLYFGSDSKTDLTYDIALLKLKSQIPIPIIASQTINRQPFVNSICLPDKDIVNTDEELALTAGFGQTDQEEYNLGPLLMGWIKLDKVDNNYTDLSANTIIAHRYPINTGTAVCKGDSGGPVIQYVGGRAVLIGLNKLITIENSGENCLPYKSHHTMQFTRVSKFIDWIVDTVNNNN